eukprot:1325297-Prymnesium_polylepis.2
MWSDPECAWTTSVPRVAYALPGAGPISTMAYLWSGLKYDRSGGGIAGGSGGVGGVGGGDGMMGFTSI